MIVCPCWTALGKPLEQKTVAVNILLQRHLFSSSNCPAISGNFHTMHRYSMRILYEMADLQSALFSVHTKMAMCQSQLPHGVDVSHRDSLHADPASIQQQQKKWNPSSESFSSVRSGTSRKSSLLMNFFPCSSN